jgi:hypothetical protein
VDTITARLVITWTGDVFELADIRPPLLELERRGFSIQMSVVPRDEIVTLGPDDHYTAAEVLRTATPPPSPRDTQDRRPVRRSDVIFKGKI